MRLILAAVACAILLSCATSPAADPTATAEPTSWHVRLQVEGGPYYRERGELLDRLSWIDRASFEATADVHSAVRALAGPGIVSDAKNEVRLSCGVSIAMNEDAATRTVTLTTRATPFFSSLLGDFSEEDRQLLSRIHGAPSLGNVENWNPAHLITATNALWHVGEARAVRLLESYLVLELQKFKGTQPSHKEKFSGRAYAVALTLFSCDLTGVSPKTGRSWGPLGETHGPICTIDDIPFATGAYGGSPLPDAGDHVIHRIRKMGQWRSAPMEPHGTPFAALNELERKFLQAAGVERAVWPNRFIESYRKQCMRCFGQVPDGGAFDNGPFHDDWNVWNDTVAAFEALYADRSVQWDKEKGRFAVE